MEGEGTTLDVPGELAFPRKASAPPSRVHLPLRAGPERGALVLSTIGWTFLSIAFAMGTVAVAAITYGHEHKLKFYLIAACLLPFSILMTVWASCAVPTFLSDALRKYPVLTIDAEGLSDTRAGSFTVPWRSIAHAKVFYSPIGPTLVRLTLREAISAKHSPFRPETMTVWRRRATELWVPTFHLDVQPHTLASAILALVRQHGGEVDTKPLI